jgi:hypothetical protein
VIDITAYFSLNDVTSSFGEIYEKEKNVSYTPIGQ